MAYTGMVKFEGEAADIPTMLRMSAEAYQDYLEDELFFVDHHGVLRSGAGQFPLAATEEQFIALRAYLETFDGQVGGTPEE